MKFRVQGKIIKEINKELYELYAFDELDPRGAKWKRVGWNGFLEIDGILFENCTDSISEIKERAKKYKNYYENLYGKNILTFEL